MSNRIIRGTAALALVVGVGCGHPRAEGPPSVSSCDLVNADQVLKPNGWQPGGPAVVAPSASDTASAPVGSPRSAGSPPVDAGADARPGTEITSGGAAAPPPGEPPGTEITSGGATAASASASASGTVASGGGLDAGAPATR